MTNLAFMQKQADNTLIDLGYELEKVLGYKKTKTHPTGNLAKFHILYPQDLRIRK